ncbi:MAG: hypothetical protein MUQ32_02430, partial [Chloroflexi bacterium]|nr:hypothetical protein [Chloroflexota bacterium]
MRRATLRLLAALISITFGAAPATLARFSTSATSAATFGTATLAAPTSLAGSGGSTATLSWYFSGSGAPTGRQSRSAPIPRFRSRWSRGARCPKSHFPRAS